MSSQPPDSEPQSERMQSLLKELEQLELQEQEVKQRCAQRDRHLAQEILDIDERHLVRLRSLNSRQLEACEQMWHQQLHSLLEDEGLLDAYWRRAFETQERKWQAQVRQLQSQLEVARSRGRRHSIERDARKSCSVSRDGRGSEGTPRAVAGLEGTRLGMEIASDPSNKAVRVVATKGLSQLAGLQANDFVTHVGIVYPTGTKGAFRQAVTNLQPGATLTFFVDRNGGDEQIEIKL
uniref:PDZ domain-containing protein n=1 Tax=Eutreptiella gymnastica TaxID=73025 RepID=A0A7S1NIM6_9EUGL|mmetsp:Transcript_41289/g.74093  ORF Transcript_41289/g.74093 Transcript_41289/m.74093 type:complete len:236 (+) Transcript_41289:73-780(+)